MAEENQNQEAEETQDQTQEQDDTQQTQDQTFTQSEVDSHISKAVDKALKNQKAQLESQKEKEIEAAKNEAAEYAKMTQKEQEEADYNKRIEELEQREKELNKRQLRGQVQDDLKDNNLPESFADTLITLGDNEKIKEAISEIKGEFDEAVNAQVKEKLRQDTPVTSGDVARAKSKDDVNKMGYKERLEFKQNHPEEYQNIMKEGN